MQGFSAGGKGIIVYFACENCAVEAERLKQLSGVACRRLSGKPSKVKCFLLSQIFTGQ